MTTDDPPTTCFADAQTPRHHRADETNVRRRCGEDLARTRRSFQTGLVCREQGQRLSDRQGLPHPGAAVCTPYGEIDIVARRRGLLAFVEVKARASLDEAAYSVTRNSGSALSPPHRHVDDPSRAWGFRDAVRCGADRAEAPSQASHGGVRRRRVRRMNGRVACETSGNGR